MTNDSTEIEQAKRYDEETKEQRKARLASKARKGKNKRHSTDTMRAQVLELSVKGLAKEEIARVVGLSKTTVGDIIRRFQPVFKALDRVDDFKKVKPQILAAGQLQALESAFNAKKLQKASFVSLMQGFEILNKAERLENGLSTENIERKTFTSIEIKDLTDSNETNSIDITDE